MTFSVTNANNFDIYYTSSHERLICHEQLEAHTVIHRNMTSSKKQWGRVAKLNKTKKEDEWKEQLKRQLCTHGITQDEFIMQIYDQRLEEYFNLEFTLKRWHEAKSGEKRWPDACDHFIQKYPDLCINEDFVKFIVGCCVTLLLMRDTINDEVQNGARIGMELALTLILVTIPKSKGQDVSVNSRIVAECSRCTQRIYTKRGLILTVAKYASCSCLDQLAASAKQDKKTHQCSGCGEEVPCEVAWLCTGCECSHYCSLECRAEDW